MAVRTTDYKESPRHKAGGDLLDDLLDSAPPEPLRLPTLPRISHGKVAAVLAWLGACYTTYLAVVGLQPGTPAQIAVAVALVVQFVLTAAERPLLRGRPDLFTVAVLLMDAAINAGGIYPALKNIGQTPTARMLIDVGVAATVDAWPAVLISLAFGAIIAAAPEALWRMRD